MLRHLTLLTLLAFATAWVAFNRINRPSSPIPISKLDAITYKKINIKACGPDWEAFNNLGDEVDIPIIPGSGNVSWKIMTKSDSAQLYFNQGMNMYYSFHIIEAMASFRKAMKFDAESPMLFWAEALTYGPNINDLGYAASPAALQAVKNANQYIDKATPIEKALIGAMSIRYTNDSADATRKSLNIAYTAEMKKAYELYPNHPDVQALYADAMMLEHPWDLWNINGTPKPWTPPIEKVLERLLAKSPNHPGANHYYIHVMEPSPFAAKALPSAARLGKITPSLSHTVHMPSHIYLRTGEFNTGAKVNENAVTEYKKSIAAFAPVTGADFLYLIHNLHMQTTVAMLAGRSKYSVQSALDAAASVPEAYSLSPAPFGSGAQYIYMVPTLANIRFGNWDALMNAQAPNSNMVYANILFHFGKGMAMAHTNKISDANAELNQMEQLMKDSGLYLPFGVFSPAIDGARVAYGLLEGSIAMSQKNYKAAIASYTKAVVKEENMVYTEPRDWLLNPKHYLGNAYVKSGDFITAEKVFRKDLLNNNENGWALYGIYQCLLGQKKTKEAAVMLARYKKAFSQADIKLVASVVF